MLDPTIRDVQRSRDLLAVVLLALPLALALLCLSLAALPLSARDRLLSVDSHWRSERVVSFVFENRVDIAVAGVGTALVVAFVVVVLPTVAG
jgi:hypothetical protein